MLGSMAAKPETNEFIARLRNSITGEVSTDKVTREFFSTDGSVFTVMPEIVVYPQNEADVSETVRLVATAAANGNKGDLYVQINVRPHKQFTREGELILSNEHIPMVDAALGTEIEVQTVDGPVVMKVPAGTQSGTDFKLSNHGVPHIRGNGRGAHIVTVLVDTPTNLSKEQREILESLNTAKKKGFFH